MAYYNPVQTTQITSALKRSNQRIAQIAKTYGKNSSIYKQEAGKFLKGAYKSFIGTSKSGNIKFDIRAINKFIRSQGDTSQVQRMLAEMGGIKFKYDVKEVNGKQVRIIGDVKELKGGGISTLTKIDKRTEKKLERMGEDPATYTKAELRKVAEELAQFSESFQTAYNEYIAKFGEEKASIDPDIKLLYGTNRTKRLTKEQFETIKEKMEILVAEAKQEALEFEKDNTDNT